MERVYEVMTTPRVDLQAINQQSEIIVRGGNTRDKNALGILRKAYQLDDDYPDVVGISVLFRVGADVDTLARANPLFNPQLSHGTVARILAELDAAGFALILYVTPQQVLGLPDHHTLAVAHINGGRIEPPPPDEPLAALIRAMSVTDNKHKRPRS